jgi:TPR repeat protein
VLFAVGQYHFIKQNYSKALPYLVKAAGTLTGGEGEVHSRGVVSYRPSLQAKYQLGVMYYDGLGVLEDPVSSYFPAPPPSWNVCNLSHHDEVHAEFAYKSIISWLQIYPVAIYFTLDLAWS